MNRNFIAIIVGLTMTLAGVPSLTVLLCEAAEKTKVPTKWAVLSDSPAGDLVFAELAAATEIELVERERFADILKEQNLSVLSDPKTVGKRLELGKMLAADRLLVLHEIDDAGKKWQRLAVFDTKSVATIFDATLFDKTDPAKIAETIAAIAVDLNREFKDGVQTVLAVPDFLSTDGLDETKPFRESFARLITVALLQRKGVSVVSFEELEALHRELEIGDTEIKRTVPLLVRGQFQAEKTDGGFSFDISLTRSALMPANQDWSFSTFPV